MKRMSVTLERQGEETKGWRYTGMGSEGWRPGMERIKDARTLMREDGMKEDGNELQGQREEGHTWQCRDEEPDVPTRDRAMQTQPWGWRKMGISPGNGGMQTWLRDGGIQTQPHR